MSAPLMDIDIAVGIWDSAPSLCPGPRSDCPCPHDLVSCTSLPLPFYPPMFAGIHVSNVVKISLCGCKRFER